MKIMTDYDKIFDKLSDLYVKYYSPTEYVAVDEIIAFQRFIFK